MATVRSRLLTYDDLLALPDDGKRYELIDGVLIEMPPPGRDHQEIGRLLFRHFDRIVEAGSLGRVYFAPADVRVGPHNALEPDLFFIRQERLHIYQSTGVMDEPPDVVVEIISPSTRRRDQRDKARLYAAAGVPEYWQFDPRHRTVRLLVLRDGQYEDVPPVAGRYHSTVIPGLVIDPETLFAELD